MSISTSGSSPRSLQGNKVNTTSPSSPSSPRPTTSKSNTSDMNGLNSLGVKCANCGASIKSGVLQSHMNSCGSSEQNAGF